MNIKTKATLGIYTLVAIILSLGTLGSVFLYNLTKTSGQIIQDNFKSIEYSRDMLSALDEIHQTYVLQVFLHRDSNVSIAPLDQLYGNYTNLFLTTLKKEEANLTETGEKESAILLRNYFNSYLLGISNVKSFQSDNARLQLPEYTIQYNNIRNAIINIQNLNMDAMTRKNTIAKVSSEKTMLYMAILVCLSLFITLPILINFPGYIANPIIEIKEKMKEIANRNYDQKLIVRSKDEMGEMAIEFNKMTDKLQEYQRSNYSELLTEKARVDSIVKNLNEGILLLDEHLNIKIINPIASNLLGMEAIEALEKYAPDLALKNDLLRELIKDVTDVMPISDKPLRITISNEENFFHKQIYKVTKINPETAEQEIAGFIISLNNITEFKKLDLAKTNFIAIISHELKTPISSIRLSLKLLDNSQVGDLNAEQKELIQAVREETDRMSRITGELLDISQVETGNIKLHLDNVSPIDVIDYSVNVLKTHLNEKKIQLIQEIPPALSMIKADFEKTVWVMTNLIANAIRYSSQNGKIIIQVKQDGSEIQFSVQDYGQGIDAKNKERIFKRFVQLDNNPNKEGVGLGLAISKEFIIEQGGVIWVDSEIGVGSTFVFRLPLIS
jgi:signal transduction histidine kinase